MAQKTKTISPTDCNRIVETFEGLALQDGKSHLHNSTFLCSCHSGRRHNMAEILLSPDLCKDFTDFQVFSIRQCVVCFFLGQFSATTVFVFVLLLRPLQRKGHYPDIRSKLNKNNENTCIDYRY